MGSWSGVKVSVADPKKYLLDSDSIFFWDSDSSEVAKETKIF
jgi:hypothetical protein